jgi:hypothetical protein
MANQVPVPKRNAHVTEGKFVKGGTNPPNTSSERPPAPGGSGGQQIFEIEELSEQLTIAAALLCTHDLITPRQLADVAMKIQDRFNP